MKGDDDKIGSTDERFKTILEQIGPDFIADGARKIRSRDIEQVVRQLDEVRRAFAEGGALDRFEKQVPALVSALEDHWNGRYPELPYWSAAVIAFGLQYVLKPVDIIPDSLPGIGQLDDAIVISHCLAMVEDDLRAYRVWKLASEL